MKEFRKDKHCTEHYTSLEELRAAYGCKPITKKRPKDEDVLKEAREKFLGTCPVCKSPMKYVSTSYSVCGNAECKGKNIAKQGEEPRYITVVKKFDLKGVEIAENLFD
jgi:hypothetical protein